MSELQPIVSLAGHDHLHKRAEAFNRKREILYGMEEELSEAREWNRFGRFSHGFWGGSTRPPVTTGDLRLRIENLRVELERERSYIMMESNGTVRP